MNKKNNVLRNIALVTQLGLNIIVPTLVCLFLGMWLDDCFSTSYWSVILLVLGLLGGGKSAYVTAVNALKTEEEKEEKPEDIVAKYNRKHGGR